MFYQSGKIISVKEAIARFLAEKKDYLSPYTLRDYEIDLNRFANTYDGPLHAITLMTLEPFFASLASLKESSQARKYTALSRFLTWAQERQLLEQNPMVSLPPVRSQVHPSPSLASSAMERLLQAIPPMQLRDRLMFRLIGEQGLRTTEVLALQVEDLDLTKQPMEIMILGKGHKRPRQIATDLDRSIRSYLNQVGYHSGPLFRAQKGKREEPLSSKSLYEAWKTYSSVASLSMSLHELRRSALLNSSLHHQEFELLDYSEPSSLKRYYHEPGNLQALQHQRKREESPTESDENHSYWYPVPTYLDIDAITTGASASQTPWRYTEVEGGHCTYHLYAECPHRLVCAHCGYFVAREDETQRRHFEKVKQHLLRLLQELTISPAEREIIRGKQGANQRLRDALTDVPTPAGPTPRQLQQMADRLEEPSALQEHEEQATAH